MLLHSRRLRGQAVKRLDLRLHTRPTQAACAQARRRRGACARRSARAWAARRWCCTRLRLQPRIP